MKKHIIFMLALACTAMWSCKDNDPEPTPETPKIELSSPADAATFNLDTDTGISFEWKAVDKITGYKLVLSANDKMTRGQEIAADANPLVVSAADMEAKMEALEMEAGKESIVYWSIVPSGNENAETYVRNIKVTRKIVPELNSPADKASLVLDYKNKSAEAVKFEWISAASSFTFELSAKSDMSDPIVSKPVSEKSLSFTNDELQALIDKKDSGLKRYKKNPFYWNVKAGSDYIGTARAIDLYGMRFFTDVRGTESITYEVAVITLLDKSEAVWLAENFRTTLDTSGNDTSENETKIVATPPADINAAFKPLIGNYYGAYQVATLKTTFATGDWEIPTWADFQKLYDAAMADPAGYNVLKHPDLYPIIPDKTNFNKWNMNMGSFGRGMWNFTFDAALDKGFWFFIFDNTQTHPKLEEGNKGYALGWDGDGANGVATLWDSPDTGGTTMRLIYTGDDDPQ